MAKFGGHCKALLAITGAYHTGGGIAAANRLVIEALTDCGYEIDLFALNENQIEIPVHRVAGRAFAGRKPAFAKAVWQAMLSRRHAFAFCDHINLAAIFLPLKMTRHTPVITRLHGVEVFSPLPSPEGRLGLKASDHLTASEFTRSQVATHFPTLRVTAIELSLPRADSALNEGATDGSPILLESAAGTTETLRSRVILHVGRMARDEQYKGQDVLIRGFPDIACQHPEAQLVLAGHGDDFERLLTLAKEQPDAVRNRIFMPGFVSDTLLQTLYQRCYLFAMPSRGEGFGLVYLEAMRWARPCLGSRTDAAAYIIRHGDTGVLVDDPLSQNEVAVAINKLLSDPGGAIEMGKHGFERLSEMYLFEHFKERFSVYVDHCIHSAKAAAE